MSSFILHNIIVMYPLYKSYVLEKSKKILDEIRVQLALKESEKFNIGGASLNYEIEPDPITGDPTVTVAERSTGFKGIVNVDTKRSKPRSDWIKSIKFRRERETKIPAVQMTEINQNK
ncbi:hypothetical protein HK096_009292, partial [Nowakowskiella sp. JEL0078]